VDLQLRPILEDAWAPLYPGAPLTPLRMRAGAAQVEPGPAYGNIDPTGHRPEREELVRSHLPVRLVRFVQPNRRSSRGA